MQVEFQFIEVFPEFVRQTVFMRNAGSFLSISLICLHMLVVYQLVDFLV